MHLIYDDFELIHTYCICFDWMIKSVSLVPQYLATIANAITVDKPGSNTVKTEFLIANCRDWLNLLSKSS